MAGARENLPSHRPTNTEVAFLTCKLRARPALSNKPCKVKAPLVPPGREIRQNIKQFRPSRGSLEREISFRRATRAMLLRRRRVRGLRAVPLAALLWRASGASAT